MFDDACLQELINQGDISGQPSLDTLDVLLKEGLIESPLRPGPAVADPLRGDPSRC